MVRAAFERTRSFIIVGVLLLGLVLSMNAALYAADRSRLLQWLPDRSTGIGFVNESRQRVNGAVAAYRSGTVAADKPLAAFVGLSDTREGVRLPVVERAMAGRWRLIGVAGAGAGFNAIMEQGSLILESDLRPDIVIIGCSPLTLIEVTNLAQAGEAQAVTLSPLARIKATVRQALWLPQRRSDITAFTDRLLSSLRFRLFQAFGVKADNDDTRSPWRPLLRTLGAERYPDAALESSLQWMRSAGATQLKSYEGNAASLQEFGTFLRALRSSGARIIIVQMPINPMLDRIMPAGNEDLLARRLREVSGAPELTVIDFTEAIEDKGFIDLVHLNTDGGQRFSDLLGKRLVQVGKVPVGPGTTPK